MTLEEAQGLVGKTAVHKFLDGPWETATITGVGEHAVHVRFEDSDEIVTMHPRHLTDPEMLLPQEKIRCAEHLIRREHHVLDDDWMFWGHLADHLNFIALVPEKVDQRRSDWREFNRAQTMATGYLRMSAARAEAGRG